MGAKVTKNTSEMKRIRNDRAGRDQWLTGIAYMITGDVQLSFGESPSSPGEPPGVDTGALRASMRVESVRILVKRIVEAVLYAAGLEFGTEEMAARPHMRPVLDDWRRRKLARHVNGLIK